jgi:ABC-type branched-subunit amino acid transport system ATPase component/predicted MFS family arabinose efflux permease
MAATGDGNGGCAVSDGSGTTEHDRTSAQQAAQLAVAVLDAEAEREAQQAAAKEQVLFANDLLPGVGDERLTLREGLALGGMFTFVVLMLLASFEELETATLAVLAPDIRDSFHVSDGVIVFLAGASGAFLVLGSLPMGWLADRFRRAPIIGWASLGFAACVTACGFVGNAFQLFWTRLGVGVSKSSTTTVHPSLIADAYPIGIRGRISAATQMAARLIGVLSPVIVAGIATAAGGKEGWRVAFLVLGIPAAIVGVFAFRMPEPPRGQFEKKGVLGEVIEDENPAPISVEAAFARLWQIRTIKSVILAFAAMGFGLFTTGVLANLFMEDHYGTKTFARGVLGTIGGLGLLVVLPFAGKYYDGLYRRDPAKALRLVGLMVLPAAVLTPAQYFMPNALLFVIMGVPQQILLFTAFTMVGPLITTIVPYRLRGMGSALAAIYIFFIGATGGALLSALLSDAFGPRAAVLTIVIPSTIIGGYLILRGSMFIRNDLSMVVEELREEMEEHARRIEDPESVPALQVVNIDYAYGPVQVLFDVGFDVRPGEVLALLGTNGAGKSTILRAIAGLGTPARGVVRLNGRNITYTTPEQRARLGIRILMGGKGIFPAMSVNENLEMAAFVYRGDDADFRRRLDRAFALFPILGEKRKDAASTLSGGQQQMLALAMILLHDPEVLAIDELSLGLAPVLVQELLAVIERLKSEGMTIIIVEQSLNVALSIADRAVFLEKGQVRFEGPAAELAERDDLARAVFLGTEGG